MDALMLVNSWSGKIPSEGALGLQSQLENLDESAAYALSVLPLKDPVVGLILGIFLGVLGVDRFYKGDIGLGIVKLLLCWLTFGVWWLIDLFLVYKGIKRDNLQKITQALAFAPKKKPNLG